MKRLKAGTPNKKARISQVLRRVDGAATRATRVQSRAHTVEMKTRQSIESQGIRRSQIIDLNEIL